VRVLVTVGTHEQPFRRLLDAAADATARRPHDEWVVQFGVGSWCTTRPGVRSSRYLDADAMHRALQWADVVVGGSGPGTVFGALHAGAWPLVLGRSPAAGEHVDDHQVRFARTLGRIGYATELRQPRDLVPALEHEAARTAHDRRRRIARVVGTVRVNEDAFRDDVWRVLGDLV